MGVTLKIYNKHITKDTDISLEIENIERYIQMSKEKLIAMSASSPQLINDLEGHQIPWYDHVTREVNEIIEELHDDVSKLYFFNVLKDEKEYFPKDVQWDEDYKGNIYCSEMRTLNYNKVEETLVKYIKGEFDKAGYTKAVIGMSGGIDSAVSAALACKALGPKNVMGILMPYSKIKLSNTKDVVDAIKICDHLGMDYITKDITNPVNSMCELMEIDINNLNEDTALRRGNICARTRMQVLFDYSSSNKALVLGTENHSEGSGYNDESIDEHGSLGFGFYTLWGDSASCVECIYPLYKTEVFKLAEHIELPEFIIKKAPSARLWDGHEDEEELGISYEVADKILYHRNEHKWNKETFLINEWDMSEVNKVFELIYKNAFKKYLPVHPDKNILKECEL